MGRRLLSVVLVIFSKVVKSPALDLKISGLEGVGNHPGKIFAVTLKTG